MSTENQQTIDRRVIERYTDQPARMPAAVRAAIEDAWGGGPVQLYAMADLDAGMCLAEAWLALGEEHVAIARVEDGNWRVEQFPRKRIEAIRETPGLSGSFLTFLGVPDEPALAVVRYTHRQRRAVENVRFVLEQELEGGVCPWVTRTTRTQRVSRRRSVRHRPWWLETRGRSCGGCSVT